MGEGGAPNREKRPGLRDHLAAIVETSNDAILSKDLNGVVVSWNKGAEALYGYTAEEIVGQPMSRLVPRDRPSEVADILDRIRVGKGVDHFETFRVHKDGTLVPVSLTISPVLDADGNIVAASTIARDISERRREDELRFQLAAIVDSSDDAILSKDFHGKIINWNKGAERLYGYTKDEILGAPISILVPDDRPGEVAETLDRIRAGEAVDHLETFRVHKDGTRVPVSLTISPVRDADGVIVAASTIARDITERKRLEAELEAARDRAMEVSRLKSDFLATMSHEIRTPMNGVIGMTGLLLDTELDPEQREYAETVRSSGEALLAIINDILDFSKIEAGKLDLEIIDFNLRNLMEEVADLLAEQAHRKGLELVTLVRPDVPAEVRGDPGRIRQILMNLVGNAVKFTDAGEVVVRAVEADETAEDVAVRFEVCDTGIGIPPEIRSALFQPFAQADASTTRTHGGSGLGLAISRQLVELMGGDISVESEEGRGSTFSFSIRLARQAGAAQQPSPRADLTGLHVLIVDDNETNRKIMSQQTASWGVRGTVVDRGTAALDALRQGMSRGETFDLALIDMDMPEMDGLELARAIGDDPATAGIPLLLLTSGAVRGSAVAAREAGFSAYLTKPVRQSQLFDAMATVLGAPTMTPKFVTRHTISEAKALSRPRLLVAEDNMVNQKVAVAMLDKLGYRADVVANGLEALEALALIPYGAVLMDCQMPEMDGYATATEIRRREHGERHVPIIAMTAGAMAGDRERCLSAGMDDYISKPVKLEDLGSALHRWTTLTDRPDPTRASEAGDLLDVARINELRSLLDAAAGDAELAELVTTFVESSRERIGEIRAAAAAGDRETVANVAHSVAGSSATLGARVVHQIARELAAGLATDAWDLGDAVDRLDAAIAEVGPVLHAALAPGLRATPRGGTSRVQEGTEPLPSP